MDSSQAPTFADWLRSNEDPEPTSIDASSQGLVGAIPLHICDIASLTVLDLGANNLTGEIPAPMGKLDLKVVRLDQNQLRGACAPLAAAAAALSNSQTEEHTYA